MSVNVAPPARKPFTSGLFSVIDFTNPDHFATGIQWEGLANVPVSGIADFFEACGVNLQGLPKNFTNINDSGTANGFTVYGGYVCAPVGYTLEYASEQAELNLLTREQQRVEQALWTGDLRNTPSFKTGTVISGGPFSMVTAISKAEEYIEKNYGSLGTIHIPRSDVVYFLKDGLLKVGDDGIIRTVLGTAVVAGSGYPKANPVSGAAGHFLVATGTLVGARTDVFRPSARRGDLLDRGKNNLYGIAERTYSIGFEPATAAVIEFTVT
jgi:hypothetical protein